MTKAYLATTREKLEQDRARLLKELETMGHKDNKAKDGSQDFSSSYVTFDEDPEDNASEIAQYSDNISIEGDLEKSLRDVEKAIARIDAGTYGTCSYCKVAIETARLEARPEASSCIKCKKTFTKEA